MVDYVTFTIAMELFENCDSSPETILQCIALVRQNLAQIREDAAEVLDVEEASQAFEYWASAFDLAAKASSRSDLKTLVRQFMITDDKRVASPYNVAQGAMKATVYCIWQKLSEGAASNTGTPLKQRGAEAFRQLVAEIAAEEGKTVEQLARSIGVEDLV